MAEVLSAYPVSSWVLLGLAAFLVGLSKTMLPGVNTVSVALFASCMPAKLSTGALLLLLIVGDVLALSIYRKDAHWPTLLRMVPAVLLGLAAGAAFLHFVDDTGVRRSIGWLLLVLMALTLWQRWRSSRGRASVPAGQGSRAAAMGYGGIGGFCTMVANSGGPAMSMYFLAARFDVKSFLGTTAWFFATMNLLKLPFSLGLGLVNTHVVLLDALLVPVLLLGGAVGWFAAKRINQKFFDYSIIVITLAGALYLVF